jgi:hypothetical protein
MKLGQKAVQAIGEWGTFRDEHRALSLCAERACVRAVVGAADEMSCSLVELHIEPQTPLALDSPALRAWGDRLGTRVRYLLEAIETVELDATRGTLLLRSSPPDKRAGGTFYYEATLEKTGRLTLCRFRFDPAVRERASIPLHITKEVLEKLLDDLEAIAP